MKKAPIILVCLIAVLIIIGAIFTSKQQKLHAVRSQPVLKNSVQQKVQPETTKTQTPVPAKVKELQKQYKVKQDEKPVNPITKKSTDTTTKYEEVKIDDSILELGLNLPYTIQVDEFTNKAKASNKVKELRDFGLPAYLTPDYSVEKNYIVCIDNFSNRPQAESAITQLQFADITGNFKVLYLPYSINLDQSKFIKNNFYSYKYHGNGSNYYFVGSFKNISTANLFRKSEISFRECSIVKR